MPKIAAPTVAEHRAAQLRALLDAARELIREDGSGLTLAAVAARAGLARSSVYQYFRSREELLDAVVADVVPRWSARITAAVATAASPEDAIVAYADAISDPNEELLVSTSETLALARTILPYDGDLAEVSDLFELFRGAR